MKKVKRKRKIRIAIGKKPVKGKFVKKFPGFFIYAPLDNPKGPFRIKKGGIKGKEVKAFLKYKGGRGDVLEWMPTLDEIQFIVEKFRKLDQKNIDKRMEEIGYFRKKKSKED